MESIAETVRSKYAAVARSDLTNENAGVRAVAQAFGYSAEELASIPAEANMGLSCGNPIATANLKAGEVVVDLGSGGGLDVFLAARKVGPKGKAIGIDMTEAMIERARKGAREGGIANVEFYLANIDELPLPDASVDCVISNCVINLANVKEAVFREMFRILKSGGRVAVSDIALKKQLPHDLATSIPAYVGCIAGAISINDYIHGLQAAGFSAVLVADSGADLNAYAQADEQRGMLLARHGDTRQSACEGRALLRALLLPQRGEKENFHEGLASILSRFNVNDYAASVKVYAIKP